MTLTLVAILILCLLYLPWNSMSNPVRIFCNLLFIPAMAFLITSSLRGTAYIKWGIYDQTNTMINFHNWAGDEQVLDAGTGLGLLMVRAAKKLTTGKCVGVDIFDFPKGGKVIEQIKINAGLEGVAEKIKIIDANILNTNFGDDSFDLVFSNMWLNRFHSDSDVQKVCSEVIRILKKNGKAIISDKKNIDKLSKAFESNGLVVVKKAPTFFTDFINLKTIIVYKT